MDYVTLMQFLKSLQLFKILVFSSEPTGRGTKKRQPLGSTLAIFKICHVHRQTLGLRSMAWNAVLHRTLLPLLQILTGAMDEREATFYCSIWIITEFCLK